MSDMDETPNVVRLNDTRAKAPHESGVVDAGALIEAKGQHLVLVKPNDTVGFVSRTLQKARIGAAVVSHDGRAIDGIISERDIAYSLADRRGELHLLPVSSLMTRNVITCRRSTPVMEIARLMTEHRIRHVPVVENRHLLGVVSIRDIIELRLEEIERRSQVLMNFLLD